MAVPGWVSPIGWRMAHAPRQRSCAQKLMKGAAAYDGSSPRPPPPPVPPWPLPSLRRIIRAYRAACAATIRRVMSTGDGAPVLPPVKPQKTVASASASASASAPSLASVVGGDGDGGVEGGRAQMAPSARASTV